MGIALEIIDIAESSVASRLKEGQVERIFLKIGKLSALVPESLEFCFEAAASKTSLAGAKLVIEEVPVIGRCEACNSQWTITQPVFICQKCKSGSIKVISGRELEIESIEIIEKED